MDTPKFIELYRWSINVPECPYPETTKDRALLFALTLLAEDNIYYGYTSDLLNTSLLGQTVQS